MAFRLIPPRAFRLGLYAIRRAGRRPAAPKPAPPPERSDDASFFDPAPPSQARPSFRPAADAASFEVYCRNLLAGAGWTASIVGGSGDQGCDLRAEMAGHSIVVQCKLYGKAAGNRAVQEVYAAQAHFGASSAMVVCDAGFTPAAHALAATTGVRLLASSDLSRLHLNMGLVQRRPAFPAGRHGLRCLGCRTLLSVPSGRSGTVRCPTCGLRFQARS